jgi:hypothetical protein
MRDGTPQYVPAAVADKLVRIGNMNGRGHPSWVRST